MPFSERIKLKQNVLQWKTFVSYTKYESKFENCLWNFLFLKNIGVGLKEVDGDYWNAIKEIAQLYESTFLRDIIFY